MSLDIQDPTVLCNVSVYDLTDPLPESGSKDKVRSLVDDLFPSEIDKTFVQSNPENIPRLVGNYELIKVLGQGSTGVVWQAIHLGTARREVALKILHANHHDEHALIRFAGEVRALAALDHPNIAKVWEYGRTPQGQPFLSMELIPGQSLVAFADTWSLSLDERIRLVIGVCHAIQHAHHRGILHRDLKPANILVTAQDGKTIPKVIDFGLAKSLQTPLVPSHVDTTQRGCLLGTLGYMSPEQADLQQHEVDIRSDLYALSAILYELLTGTLPITREELHRRTLGDALKLIVNREPELASKRVAKNDGDVHHAHRLKTTPDQLVRRLEGGIDAILQKGLSKERPARYQSASEMADDLEQFLAGGVVRARQRTFWYLTKKLVKKHRSAVSLAALIALVVIAGLITTSIGLVWALHERNQANQAKKQADHERIRAIQFRDDAEKYGAFLANDVLAFPNPEGADGFGNDITLAEAIDSALDRIDSRFHDSPRAEALARLGIAQSYFQQGRSQEAEKQARIAVNRLESLGSDYSSLKLDAEELLIRTLLTRNAFDLAQEQCRQTAQAAADFFGLTHDRVTALRLLLVDILIKKADFPEAERTLISIKQDNSTRKPEWILADPFNASFIKLFSEWAKHDPAMAPRVIEYTKTLANLMAPMKSADTLEYYYGMSQIAFLLKSNGQLEPALQILRDLYQDSQESQRISPSHLIFLTIQNQLGQALFLTGRSHESLLRYQQAYADQKTILSLKHHLTQNTLQALINFHLQRGAIPWITPDLAIDYQRALVEGFKSSFGSDKPKTVMAEVKLLELLVEQDRWRDALALAEALRARFLAGTLTNELAYPHVLALHALAVNRSDPSLFSSARLVMEEAQKAAKKLGRSETIALIMNHYGWLLADRLLSESDKKDAESYLLNSLINLPPDRSSQERALRRLIALYQRLNRPDAAERYQWILAEMSWKN